MHTVTLPFSSFANCEVERPKTYPFYEVTICCKKLNSEITSLFYFVNSDLLAARTSAIEFCSLLNSGLQRMQDDTFKAIGIEDQTEIIDFEIDVCLIKDDVGYCHILGMSSDKVTKELAAEAQFFIKQGLVIEADLETVYYFENDESSEDQDESQIECKILKNQMDKISEMLIML